VNLPDGDSRHGTFHAYNDLKCRCDLCSEVARVRRAPKLNAQRRRQRALREAAGIKPIPHLRIADLEGET
jgi:hypothetical protein